MSDIPAKPIGISVELRLIENANSLKAAAKVTVSAEPLGEITLCGFRIIEKERGKPWVGLPQESYEKGGEWKNIPLLELSPRGKRTVAEAILAEYARLAPAPKESSTRPQKV